MEHINDSEKTVEQLAREAMDAIKQADKIHQLREEQEERDALKAQEALKQEVQNKIKRKLRELQKEEDKKPIEVIDTRFLVSWKSIDKYGINYEGEYNENKTFRIKKGLYLYHLYVVDSNLMIEGWQKSTCTSSNLDTLKEKADSILKQANEKFLKSKKN